MAERGRRLTVRLRHPPRRARGRGDSANIAACFQLVCSCYPQAVLRRIAFIVFAQRIGLTLDEIGTELAKLPAEGVPTGRDWSRLSSTWTSRIDQRIAELERLKRGLTVCIGCGCLSLDRCRLANPADRAARLGPGPRYWIGDRPRT
jgi:MerR family transcriptional regulator, redox-sensitive transcriptional activator SoxR